MNEARNMAKMMKPMEQKIGADMFYIYPMPAFQAAYMSTEIINLLAPLVGGIASAFRESGGKDGEGKSIMDMDISEAAPHIAGAFASLSPDKMDSLMRRLILDNNVAVIQEGSNEAAYLTEDLCNVVFSGNVQNMFVLAFYSIKVNYGDFFGMFGSQSGSVKDAVTKILSPGMAPLT